MQEITDIKIRVKVVLRYLDENIKQTEIKSGYHQFKNFEEFKGFIELFKYVQGLEEEDEEYDFLFYPKLDMYYDWKKEKEITKGLKPLDFEQVKKLFEYIEEILYVNKSKEIQHSFNLNEIDFFISNL